jgi:hypothetical protein
MLGKKYKQAKEVRFGNPKDVLATIKFTGRVQITEPIASCSMTNKSAGLVS